MDIKNFIKLLNEYHGPLTAIGTLISALGTSFLALFAYSGVSSWKKELVIRRKLEVIDAAYKDLAVAIDSINFMRNFLVVIDGIEGIHATIKIKYDSAVMSFLRLAEAKTQLEIVEMLELADHIEKIREIPNEVLGAAKSYDHFSQSIKIEFDPEKIKRLEALRDECDKKVYYRDTNDYYSSTIEAAKSSFIQARRKLTNK